MANPKYLLVKIIEARCLPAADANGSSDPYCKVLLCGHSKHKTKTISRTLDPCWDETFSLKYHATDLIFVVYDHDKITSDDQIGRTTINAKFFAEHVDEPFDFWLPLSAPVGGFIHVAVCATDRPDNSIFATPNKLLETKLTVTIIEAADLRAADLGPMSSDPYAVLTVDGGQRHKTNIRMHNLNPTWNKEYTVTVTPGANIKVFVMDYDRFTADDQLGFVTFHPGDLCPGETADFWAKLQGTDARGFVHLKTRLDGVPEERKEAVLPCRTATVGCPAGSLPKGAYSVLPTDHFYTDADLKKAQLKGVVAGATGTVGVRTAVKVAKMGLGR